MTSPHSGHTSSQPVTEPSVGTTSSSYKMAMSVSASSNSSSSLSNYFEKATPTSVHFPTSSPPSLPAEPHAEQASPPTPTRSVSASTPTIRSPPGGGGSQTKRHSMRSMTTARQPSSSSLDRSTSSYNTSSSQAQPPRPTSPITSSSIHKSLTALDAKSITLNMEKSTQHMRGEDVILTSPSSPGATMNPSGFGFPNSSSQSINHAYPSVGGPPNPSLYHHPYHRQGSISNITLPTMVGPSLVSHVLNNQMPSPQGDVWQALCVRVLPLFNGEGVKGSIEDLNELLRRCLTDPISPQLYRDIEALLRDGMFTLNAKMFGVTDEKLLDRLVEQWSFFFTYALPYFEAVFLPLRTDVRYPSIDEAERWNVRSMALRSFRDNMILLQTKRLEDVFAKLFTDFGSSQNPAATAAKMLQMTSLLASAPDHNEEIERVLSNLRANWKIMMTKGDRRGFAGVRKTRSGSTAEHTKHMFGALS